MKTPAPLILLLTLASIVAASAQSQPRVRRVPTPPSSTATRSVQPVAAQLEENITIALAGALSDGSPIDIALTGCGKRFQAEMVTGKVVIGESAIPVIGNVTITVSENDGAYTLDYQIGVRSPVKTGEVRAAPGPPARTSIGFQDIMITGAVKCAPGKAVEIFKAGDHSLKLNVKKAAGS